MAVSTTETLILNLTTTQEQTTSVWDEPTAKAQRRTIYYTLHGVVGLLIALFNGFVLVTYWKRKKVRQHISMVMLTVFVFCFFHGLIAGVIYPLQRVYRYTMEKEICVINTMMMDFADNFILTLLPVLAIERLILLKYPKISSGTMRKWSVCSLLSVFVLTICFTWLPLIPHLDVPTTKHLTSDNTNRQEELDRFYQAYSCHGLVNKKNYLEPIFTVIIELICVVIVIGVYLWMFVMLRLRLSSYTEMTETREQQLRKAALVVLAVSVTFIFTFLPYGVTLQIRNFCKEYVDNTSNGVCVGITLELRFIFSLLAHVGNLLAPMLFALMNKHIKKSLIAHLKCLPEPVHNEIEFNSVNTGSSDLKSKSSSTHDNCAYVA